MKNNNKVKFNICNCHYALQKTQENGEMGFETPVAMPGAVSIALDPNGEPESFYADGIEYYIIANNMGYDGDLELALIPESLFENIAYTMAKHADPQIPNEVDEWLDGFNTFSIYQVLPQLIELWGFNVQTDVEAKKNFAQLSGK